MPGIDAVQSKSSIEKSFPKNESAIQSNYVSPTEENPKGKTADVTSVSQTVTNKRSSSTVTSEVKTTQSKSENLTDLQSVTNLVDSTTFGETTR
jgi:hypothetical protein